MIRFYVYSAAHDLDSILPGTGNFGLSTDNFQFVPNGQGGYSMNFVQNPR